MLNQTLSPSDMKHSISLPKLTVAPVRMPNDADGGDSHITPTTSHPPILLLGLAQAVLSRSRGAKLNGLAASAINKALISHRTPGVGDRGVVQHKPKVDSESHTPSSYLRRVWLAMDTHRVVCQSVCMCVSMPLCMCMCP